MKIMIMLAFPCFFYSCNREMFDYRSKYTGNWSFIVEISEVNTDSIGYFAYDTICFDGVIGLGDDPDGILIQYTEDNTVVLKVNENGKLSGFSSHYSAGEFISNNKVHLYLRNGGIGGGVIHVVNGDKVKQVE